MCRGKMVGIEDDVGILDDPLDDKSYLVHEQEMCLLVALPPVKEKRASTFADIDLFDTDATARLRMRSAPAILYCLHVSGVPLGSLGLYFMVTI